MVEVRMDYDAVGALADEFAASAETLHELNRALELAITLLRTTAFVGNVGNAALAHYLEGVQPASARLAATCEELSDDLIGAIRALRDGDLSGSQRFSGAGGGVQMRAFAAAAPVRAGSLGGWRHGVDGWSLAAVQGGFAPNALAASPGATAAAFGAANLLRANGCAVQQVDPARLGAGESAWFDLLSGGDAGGFPPPAVTIVEQHGMNCVHGDLGGAADRRAAEQFLIERVGGGTPVYASARIDDAFGVVGGAHAYTVLGVQQAPGGGLSRVLAATSWPGEQRVFDLPAASFVDDWLQHHNGEYIIIAGAR